MKRKKARGAHKHRIVYVGHRQKIIGGETHSYVLVFDKHGRNWRVRDESCLPDYVKRKMQMLLAAVGDNDIANVPGLGTYACYGAGDTSFFFSRNRVTIR